MTYLTIVRMCLIGAASIASLRTIHAEPFTAVSIPDLSSTGLEALAARFLDAGATLQSTPTLTGMNGQLATFANFASSSTPQAADFSIDSGVILSTGHAAAAADTYFGGPSTSYDQPGDSGLTALGGSNPTYDAISFYFTFTTSLPTFSLNYAFASAEYPDAVNTQSNDIMAIYLNDVNIAVLPGGAAVSVNTVNSGSNSGSYLRDSTFGITPFAYGGITTLLTASGAVNPGVNSLKIVIADGGDHLFDSAVLLQDYQAAGPAPVPEPSTWIMMGGALVLFSVLAGKRMAASN